MLRPKPVARLQGHRLGQAVVFSRTQGRLHITESCDYGFGYLFAYRLGPKTVQVLDVDSEVQPNGLREVIEPRRVISHCGGRKQAFDKPGHDFLRHIAARLIERLGVEQGVARPVVVQGLPLDDPGEVVRDDAERLGVPLDGRLRLLDESLSVLGVRARRPTARRDERSVLRRQDEPR